MQDTLSVLEFDKIRDSIASFCRTEKGKGLVKNLHILPLEELKKEIAFLEQAQIEIDLRGRMPIEVSADLDSSIKLARKGHVLSIEDLERIASDCVTASSLKRFFALSQDKKELAQYVENLPELLFIEKDIHKIIAPDLSIFDNASPTLKKIRVAISRLERDMVSRLGSILEQNKEFLTGTNLTLRNGHYVLPVSNAYKSKVKGIVQDISGSGGTTFIEPEVLVAMNNKMAELRNDEKEEIRRLLAELSAEVGGSSESLIAQNDGIGYLDFLQAKVLYGEKLDGHIATLSEDGSLYLPSARHPLLDQAKVVPNDFVLSPGKKVVIISGPNAGGKTVALKTLAINAVFFEMALLLPCLQGAILPYFHHIYLDIGDSQSLSDNLSTFSGHMANIASICNVVGGKDLVLLDEVGTGTSPKEGEALAEAIVTFLLSKHCYTLISSHFEGLKAFALSNKEIENASMLYDDEALLPTYRLKMGLPGESYGLKVAERFGIRPSIIAQAEQSLASNTEVSVSEAIEKLASITQETEELKRRLANEVAKTEAKEKELRIKENNLAHREENFLATVRVEKERILGDAEREIDAIIASLNSPEVKLHQAIAAKKRLEALEEKKRQEESYSGEVNVGDYVKMPSFGIVGKVTRISGKNIVISTQDGIDYKTTKDKVLLTPPPEEKKVPMKGAVLDQVANAKSLSLELNIIGLHVDEAMAEVAAYLDKCRLKGFKRVRIIHGYGSGALRKATHNYLKAHSSFVESYEAGGEFEGGSGATVVKLK